MQYAIPAIIIVNSTSADSALCQVERFIKILPSLDFFDDVKSIEAIEKIELCVELPGLRDA